MAHDVLIFGASSRAAAFSALRAGLRPCCADYFADRDLAAICPVIRIDTMHARRDFLAVADSFPPSCWFYTGGFENHPEWVEHIARRHRLWGASAGTLGQVRDPAWVAALLDVAAIPVPAVRRDPEGLPRDGSWLVKPLRSGGGRDIWPLEHTNRRSLASCYFQERIDGPSFSALFIGTSDAARLVGVTQQWLGIPGSPFGYRGSIGPWPIDPDLTAKLKRLGDVLVSASGLMGCFGVDFVLQDGEPWPVEINPRYTASLEIHELALGQGLIGDHRRACEEGSGGASALLRTNSARHRVIGKLVLHAPRDLVAPEIAFPVDAKDDLFEVRPIADIPWPGTAFAAGEPVMTIMAGGADVASCQWGLASLERTWLARLGIARD